MNTDTHIVVKLPFGNQLPTQEAILERLKGLYVEHKPLLPLLKACAEETERMMLELFEDKRKRPCLIGKAIGGKGQFRMYGYTCPVCFRPALQANFCFCPGCGNEIQWI